MNNRNAKLLSKRSFAFGSGFRLKASALALRKLRGSLTPSNRVNLDSLAILAFLAIGLAKGATKE